MSRNKGQEDNLIFQAFWLGVSAFLLSFILNTSFEGISRGIPPFLGVPLFISVIILGVVCDGLGLASATATEESINAMASRKVAGAREGLWFVRNAPKVSSVFNDLMGDVASTLSGALALSLAVSVLRAEWQIGPIPVASISVGFASLLTVSGKALFKTYVLRHPEAIVLMLGRMRYLALRVAGKVRRKEHEACR